MFKHYKSYQEIDKQEITDFVISHVLNKVIGLRYLPTKYLLQVVESQLSIELNRSQKIHLMNYIVTHIENYLSQFDYRLVTRKKRFNDKLDIDVMFEIYDIPENERSLLGSYYFEKYSDFLTKNDLVENQLELAKLCNQYL